MRQILLTSTIVLVLNNAFGQYRTGLHLSNYNTSQSIILQPTSGFNSPNAFDFTFLGGQTFVENDYAYFMNASVLDVIRKRDQIEVIEYQNQTEEANNSSNSFDPLYFTFFNPRRPIDVLVKTEGLGPSFSFKINDWSFGAFTKTSQVASVNNVDPKLHFFNLKGNTDDIGTLMPVDFNFLNWAEIGLNVGKRWKDRRDREFVIGANVKYLMGMDALHLKAQSNLAFGATIQTLKQTQADLQYATNVTDDGNYDFNINGRGLGADLGFSFIQGTRDDRPYRFKLGINVLDLGRIQFKSRALSYAFNSETDVVFDSSTFAGSQSIENYAIDIANEFDNNPEALKDGNSYYSFLPTALHLTADYSITPNWFVNASAIRRMKIADNQLEAGNIVSVSGRYESHWFEAGLHVVLYNDRDMRLGSWIRLGPLTIGSDHVLSILTKQNELSGSDIYFSLKWIPFNASGMGRNGGRKAKDIKCFTF